MIRAGLLILVCIVLSGCQSGPRRPLPPIIDPVALPPDVNESRYAAMLISHRPVVANETLRREIDLHASLYRAAAEGTQGPLLLEPLVGIRRAGLEVEPRDFQIRVLAALADLQRPIAWAARDGVGSPGELVFPGTRMPASTIGGEIRSRSNGGQSVQASVRAADAPARAVTAQFKAGRWSIEQSGKAAR